MQTLDRFIARHIPAAAALGLRVVEASPQRVAVAVPLERNGNPHRTVFGGSQALSATLSAWSLVCLNFPEVDGNIVIRSSRIRYLKPAPGDMTAVSLRPDISEVGSAKRMLAQKGRAKIRIRCGLYCNDTLVSEWDGEFVLSHQSFQAA